MTITIHTDTDTLSCDYCGQTVAIDYGMTPADNGRVIFTTPSVITPQGIYCETCAVDADGWPLVGEWVETDEEITYAELRF